MSRVKTVTQTFRFDANTHDVLVEEARRQRVSMNVLVGHLLDDYAKWGMMADRVRLLCFGPPVVASIFLECPDEVVKKIGNNLGESHPVLMLASDGLSLSPDTAKVLIEVWLSKYAHWFEPLQIKVENETWQIHLMHGISRKWSLFLCEYMNSMFETLGFQLKEKSLQDHSTTLIFKIPNK